MSHIGIPVKEFECDPLELPLPLRTKVPVEPDRMPPSHEPNREPVRTSPVKEPVPV